MANIFELWNKEPYCYQLTAKQFVLEITAMLDELNEYFGYVGATKNDFTALHDYFIKFAANNPQFKMCDMRRAITLHREKVAPQLNKITPSYINDAFKRYTQTEERRYIIDMVANNTGVKKIEATTWTPEQQLGMCYKCWKEKGIIYLNNGSVYTNNLQLITDTIGQETIDEIAATTKTTQREKLTAQLKNGILSRDKKWDIERELEQLENNGATYIVAMRKAILERYFQTIEMNE